LRRNWSIPVDDIETGLNENDEIPSIDFPNFVSLNDAAFMKEGEDVLIIRENGETKIYPEKILDWHQMVNDQIGDQAIAVSYSTLSGMASVWKRLIESRTLSFGVSRYLYKNNQIYYDRETLNYWSQILGRSVSGNIIDTELEIIPSSMMNWEAAQKYFPDAKIMSPNTGFVRDYNAYPYTDYRTDNNDFIFDPDSLDVSQIAAKERVLGIDQDSTRKVYRFDSFDNEDFDIIYDFVGLRKVVVFASKKYNYINAFFNPENIAFNINSSTEMIEDTNGNTYNLLGQVIAGPDEGNRLAFANAKFGYWLVWYDYFPDIEIY